MDLLNQEPPFSENPVEGLLSDLQRGMSALNTLITETCESTVPLVPKVSLHLLDAKGKRLRPLLTMASWALYKGHHLFSPEIVALAGAVELIHSATLLHDDVVDDSHQRRGKRSANIVWGNKASILVGDFLFSQSFQMMVKTGSLDILNQLSKASSQIAEGEVLQLQESDNIKMEKQTYFDIISAKTAVLFAAGCQTGAMLAGAPEDHQKSLYTFGHHFGILFQLIDDMLDYFGDNDGLGKNIGDDFREGKITLPLLLLHDVTNDSEKVEAFLKADERTDEMFQNIRQDMEHHDIQSLMLKEAQTHAQKAKEAILSIGDIGNGILNNMVNLIDHALTRNS